MADETTEQTLVAKIAVETQESIAKLIVFQNNVKEAKDLILATAAASSKLGTDTAAAYNEAAVAVKRYLQEVNAANNAVLAGNDQPTIPFDSAAVTMALSQINQEVRQSEAVAREEIKLTEQERAKAAKERQAQERQAAKLAQQNEKDRLKAIRDRERAEAQANKGQIDWTQKLGTAFQVVFGLTLIQLLQTAYNWTVKLLENMLELSTVMYRFEVSIRGLQRTGLNTTLAEWDGIIASLKSKFPFFSEKDFRAASAQAALMTREFGFTAEQMQHVVEVSAVLAELTGRDLTDSITGLTYAISSGYFEALQRAGININRQIVANEALRRGYGANYNALDQNVRAMITFDLILGQLSSLQQDAGKFAETSAGQWKKLSAAWQDLGNKWSSVLEPALVGFLKFLGDATTGFTNFVNLVMLGIALMVGGWIGLFNGVRAAATMMWKNLVDGAEFSAKEMLAVFLETVKQSQDAAVGVFFGNRKLLGDTGIGAGLDAEAKKVEEVIRDLNAKIKAETVQAEQDLLKIHIDYQNDLLKLERDYAQKRLDLARKLAQKMQDIERDAAQKTEDVNRDYQNDLADIDRDYNNKLADAQQDYRNKEYEAEQKFQEQMRQLREEYLFDLQDAIRERDAGQILRLMRRYNLDKQQANREYLNDKEARERAYQQELADLARQRQEKRDDRARDYQQQLEEIAIEKQRQIEEAQLWYQRELEDLRIWLAQQRQERLIRYKEQIRDLNITIKARLDSLARGLIDEQSLTAQGAKQVYDILNAYYGPGGYMEGLFNYYLQMRNRALGGGNAPNLGVGGGPGFAEGGSFIANSRMSATFGERGPEWVQAIPLTYAGSNVGQFFGTKGVGGGQIGGGKVSVMIDLSDGLVGKIVDNTMGELAEVMIQARGGRTQ